MDVDGKRTAFSGDLMHSPGKLVNLWDTQVNYGGAEGVDLGAFSLARLREQKPALLCPSHGEPLPDPSAGIQQTVDRLVDYYNSAGNNQACFHEVMPSAALHRHQNLVFLLSNSGKRCSLIMVRRRSSLWNFGGQQPQTDSFCGAQHRRSQDAVGMKSIDSPWQPHATTTDGFPH
jgi:hypothetical protein